MLINNPVITGSFIVNGTNFITNTPSTGSNTFNGNQIISGSAIVTGSLQVTGSITTTGTITAQTLVVQTVTSSVVFSSGSNVFGNSLSNVQQMTGSVNVTGSFAVTTTGTELQVGATGVTLGNALTDNHNVTGSLRVTGSVTSQAGFILGNSQAISPTGSIGYNSAVGVFVYGKSGSEADFRLYNAGGLTAMSVVTGTQNTSFAGNVGIGTTTLATYGGWGGLDVRGGNGGHIIVANSNGTNRGEILTDGNGFNISAFTNNNIAFKTNNTFRAFITNNGLQLDNGELNTPKALWFQANSNTGGNLGTIDWYNVQWDGAIRAQIKGETDTGLANGRLVFSTGGGGVTERMRITAGGTVLVNATVVLDASAKFQTNGNVYLGNQPAGAGTGTLKYNASTGLVTFDASARVFKKDIVDLEYGLDSILRMNPKKYKWKSNDAEDLGFIADEMYQVVPEVVYLADNKVNETGLGDGEPMGINYDRLIPVLVKAIQELKAEIETLKNK